MSTMINNNNNSMSPNSGCNSPSSKKRVTHNPYRFGMELQKQRVATGAADEHHNNNNITKDALTPATSSTRSSCHDHHIHHHSHEDSAYPAAFLGSHNNNSYPISETPSYESSERSPSASEEDGAAMMMMMGDSSNSNNNNNCYNAAYFPNTMMMGDQHHHQQQQMYSNGNNSNQHYASAAAPQHPLAVCEKAGIISPMRSNAASCTHSGINLAFGGSPVNAAAAAASPPPTYYGSAASSSLTPTNSASATSVASSAAAAAAANSNVPMLPLPAELILGKSFPHAMPVRNKSIICKRFLEAKCINRNPNVAHTPCCQLGGACPFRHVTREYEEPVPKSICKFHLNGACLRDVCPFFHGTRAQLQALHASGATMYRPSEYWCIVDAQDPNDCCDCARRHK